MTKEQAIKGLKENLCSLCAYGSQNMDSCDIRECDNRDYIQTLEQQPSDDCVSRQVVLDLMQLKMGGKELYKAVYDLPPVTPTQRWIPIERRDLTQEEKDLYSSLNGDEPEYMIENQMPDDGEEVLVSWGGNVLKDIFSHDYFDFENISVDEIEAWMPLPEPYKADKGERI